MQRFASCRDIRPSPTSASSAGDQRSGGDRPARVVQAAHIAAHEHDLAQRHTLTPGGPCEGTPPQGRKRLGQVQRGTRQNVQNVG